MANQSPLEIRVMMIGPGKGIVGGINTLVDTIVPSVQKAVTLDYFPTVSDRPIKKSGQFSFLNIAIATSQFSRFIREASIFHPQIMHIHSSESIAWIKDTVYIWLGKAFKSKIIIHFHAADFYELYTRHSPLYKAYTRYMLSKVDAVISVSEKWKQNLSSIIAPEKIHTFKNCIQMINPPKEHLQDLKIAYGLFLGCIGPRKGAFDLIEAINSIKLDGRSLHIWLAGYEERQGDMKIAQDRLSELKLDSRCELVGVVRDQAKTDLLQKMDFFILPSYNEGLPMAVLEAMAEGKAIISTPVGGIPEIVLEGYNGFLINPGDINDLAEKIGILVEDIDLSNRMGKNSLQIVKDDLNVEIYIDRLVQLYEKLENTPV